MTYQPRPYRPSLAHRAIALALGVLSLAALLASAFLFISFIGMVLT